MNRYRRYEPDQSVMIPLNFSQVFPQGTFERFLVDTIQQFDLSQFEKAWTDKSGETPYDPRSLLGIILYGFSVGVYSSRKLSKACANDFRYMLISGYAEPEHTTICRFILQHQEALKNLFVQILYIADNMNLIDYRMIAIDGTKIKGNASKQFSGTIDDFRKKKDKIEAKIKKALEKQAEADTMDDLDEKQYWAAKADRYRKSKDRITTFLETATVKKNENGTEREQNGTDPDCRMMKSNGVYLSGYNGQVGIDVSSGLLIGAEVVDQTNDKHAFPTVVEAIKASLPEASGAKVDTSAYLADNGYYTPDTLDYARTHGLEIYVSDRTSSALYDESGCSTQKITSKDCQIEKTAEGDITLICPGLTRWTTYQVIKCNERTVYRFHTGVKKPECLQCRFWSRCAGATKSMKKDFEIDERLVNSNEFMVAHRERLHSAAGKRMYSKRMSAVERVFGNVKENGRYRSVLRRGLQKVETEWKLISSCFNLRRMHVLLQRV